MSDSPETTTETTDVTDAIPTLEPKTRKSVKQGAAIAFAGVAALLLADDRLRKFKSRKNVTVVVEEKPEPTPDPS